MNEFNEILDLEGLTYYDSKIKDVIEEKAPLESPELIGIPKAPTASVGTNTTQIATTAFVKNTLDTLTFDDTTSTYSTLSEANTAAETSTGNIKSDIGLITFLKNAKQSFSAIVQGLKILGTNVGAISGITDSLTATSSNVALSANGGNNLQGQIDTLNSNLEVKVITYKLLLENLDSRYQILLNKTGRIVSIICGAIHVVSGDIPPETLIAYIENTEFRPKDNISFTVGNGIWILIKYSGEIITQNISKTITPEDYYLPFSAVYVSIV